MRSWGGSGGAGLGRERGERATTESKNLGRDWPAGLGQSINRSPTTSSYSAHNLLVLSREYGSAPHRVPEVTFGPNSRNSGLGVLRYSVWGSGPEELQFGEVSGLGFQGSCPMPLVSKSTPLNPSTP